MAISDALEYIPVQKVISRSPAIPNSENFLYFKPNHVLYHFYFCLATLCSFFETKGRTK